MPRWEDEGREGRDERRWGGGESGREEWRRRSGYGFDPRGGREQRQEPRGEDYRGRRGEEWRPGEGGREERWQGGGREEDYGTSRGYGDPRGWSRRDLGRQEGGGAYGTYETEGGYGYGGSAGHGARERGERTTYGGAYVGGFGDYGGTGGYGAREHERHGEQERGWRPSEEERTWAERGAHRGGGGEGPGLLERMGEKLREKVRRVARGPKGYKRSDERIREDVSERIARSGVDAREVEVQVESGEVTLTGTVESREVKRWLEDLADDVFGVDEVHNHLRLRREAQAQEGERRAPEGQPPVHH